MMMTGVIAGSVRAGSVRARAVRGAGPGSPFRVAEDESALGSAQAACPVAMPSLLAMQEAQSDAVSDRDAKRHGTAVMDELVQLQRAMLGGGSDAASLDRLASLATPRPAAADPRLDGVLRAIQLRAQIELARRVPAASG